jgi:acyl carrier protein
MQQHMQNLITAMRNVFPDLAAEALVPTLRLSDCPNWDSMTAVNLLMEVETACGAKMEAYEPADSTTLADLAAAIAAAGGRP